MFGDPCKACPFLIANGGEVDWERRTVGKRAQRRRGRLVLYDRINT